MRPSGAERESLRNDDHNREDSVGVGESGGWMEKENLPSECGCEDGRNDVMITPITFWSARQRSLRSPFHSTCRRHSIPVLELTESPPSIIDRCLLCLLSHSVRVYHPSTGSITLMMKHFLLLSLLNVVASATAASFVVNKKAHPSSLGPPRGQHAEGRLLETILQPPQLASVVSVRGGGGGGSNSDSIVLSKLRNLIRSLIQICDSKLPLLSSLLKTFFGIVERIFNVSLLPNKKETLTPKMKKKRRKTKTDRETATTTTTTTTASNETKPSSSKKPSSKKKTSSQSANKHLSTKLKSTSPNYRIQKELKEFMQHPPPNLKVKVGSNIRVWIIEMRGADGSIYEGETYRLRVQFPPAYPTVPPSVYFLPPTPQHEHVYTNGDICLSLLGKGWRPTMTAQSIAVSILSILSSAQTKSLPMDNARHCQNKPGQYQKDWVYHDDNC